MTRVLTIIGARPQFIKAAVVSRAFSDSKIAVDEIIVHTGQHYDSNMSDIFLRELDIPPPKYNLGIGGGSHGQNTGRMLEKLELLMLDTNPDWVLVYGDTNSTLAGALAASKLNIPIAHVEAGLRSFNRDMPEEINRILTDHASDLLLTPTTKADENLSAEGIPASKIHNVGDVMLDAALYYKGRASQPVWFEKLHIGINNFVLCTIHRAENTDDPVRLRSIFEGLAKSNLTILLPLHPRTRNKVEFFNIQPASNIYITEPLGYLDIVWLESNCLLIATDSGGMQKEAYFHRTPCVTLRTETEWVELIDRGWNRLAAPDQTDIISSTLQDAVGTIGDPRPLYGDGDAGEKIAKLLS